MKLCLPVVKTSIEEVREELSKAHADYSFYEVWIRHFAPLDKDALLSLVRDYPGKLILPFRLLSEDTSLPAESLLELLSMLSGEGVLVDFDMERNKEERDLWKKEKLPLNVILSFHDYEKTPSFLELQKRAEQMAAHHPKVVKIATFCQSEADALKLLELLLFLKSKGVPSTVLGMGEHGQVTRVFGSLWGNEFLYAPEQPEEQSAPGQLTREEYQRIFAVL